VRSGGRRPVSPLLGRIDAYCDAVPRSGARVEELGPLRLFVADGVPWPYYARPSGGAVTVADVRAVRSRQWALGAPETLEWIAELAPTLGPAALESGLAVVELPLMALDRPTAVPATAARIRRLQPDDRALAAARAVADLAFTGRGAAGDWPERRLGAVRDRMAAGLMVTYVAEDAGGVLAAGSHQPAGGATEIVGIGTLPDARRRGLGAAVTAALVADARRGGAETVFLSAGSDANARLYGRVGFSRVGTSGLAAPPVSS